MGIRKQTPLVLPFSRLDRHSVAQAGGKGANLGELTKLKIPVPPGFVVTADAFERFLEETDLRVEIEAGLRKVDHRDINSVDRFSNETRALIHDAAIPPDIAEAIMAEYRQLKAPLVAVRSSATAEDSSVASWAGELETYLFVTKQQLLTHVRQCWSSLFTPRAIFYRFERKLHRAKVSVAVVVQTMVNSETSGVCFTVHPVTKDKRQLVIEAGFGLGEAIVSGMITPDTYVIDKQRGAILDINVARKEKMVVMKARGGTRVAPVPALKRERQVLNGREMLSLAALCQQIERHYRKPQDIEWARRAGKVFITQTRPITTL